MRKTKRIGSTNAEAVMNKLALSHQVRSLDLVEKIVQHLAVNTPSRTTVRQLYAFMILARANAEGRLMTLTEMKDLGGADTKGEAILGQHMNRSYQIFLDPEEARDTEALGWITRMEEPSDKRKNYLVLTDEGREIANQIAEIAQTVERDHTKRMFD